MRNAYCKRLQSSQTLFEDNIMFLTKFCSISLVDRYKQIYGFIGYKFMLGFDC